MRLKTLAMYGIPVAGMFVLPKVVGKPGVEVAIQTEPISKMRGRDKFKMAIKVKNNSSEAVDIRLVGYAKAETPAGARTVTMISKTFTINANTELRVPSSGYAEYSIPRDWPTGLTKAVAEAVLPDTNEMLDSKEKDAWDVGFYASVTVTSAPSEVYTNEDFDVTLSIEVEDGSWNVYIWDETSPADTITGPTSTSKTYTLTAPSESGSYHVPVKVVRAYTGETAETGFDITVKEKPNIEITSIEVS